MVWHFFLVGYFSKTAKGELKMDDIIKVIRIACYNLKKTFTSSKIYIIIILSFMYIQFMLNPVKVFAENVQIGVSSYLFPFLFS